MHTSMVEPCASPPQTLLDILHLYKKKRERKNNNNTRDRLQKKKKKIGCI